MINNFNWPLAENNFTFLDRLKICKFFLNKSNRWTQDKYVREYERKIAEYVGAQYAIVVSSGSSANQLIAQGVKDKLVKSGEWNTRNEVILSSVSWQTNASVWVREGFKPVFLDIQMADFAIDEEKLKEYLKKNSEKVAAIFPTSVLGYTPNIELYNFIHWDYPSIYIAFDNCENFFGETSAIKYPDETKIYKQNVNSWFTCSTSGFIAHQINSGGELGIIFTNDYEEYKYFIMARAHGLSRNLIPYRNETIFGSLVPWDINEYYPWEHEPIYNPLVDQQFNFHVLSSNYRNTDIAAFCSLLDFKRVNKNRLHRKKIYSIFKQSLDPIRYYLPLNRYPKAEDVAFCLPIIVKGENKENRLEKVKEFLDKNKIERRGFISGNMLRQKCYQKYGDYKNYDNAEYINNFAIYIGLNSSTTEEIILELTSELNKL